MVLWEIFSLGEDPYPDVTNEEMVTFIQDERRMTCPKGCPKDIFGLMVDCWQTVSCKRPSFQQISTRVDSILRQNVSQRLFVLRALQSKEIFTLCSSFGSCVI